jgi:hypothetical protein
MKFEDLYKPAGLAAALAAAAGTGLVIGLALSRNPAIARMVATTAARGLERLQIAVAETREELSDIWAEARDTARAEVEEAAFARDAAKQAPAAAGAAASAAGAAEAASADAGEASPPARDVAPTRAQAAATVRRRAPESQ